MIEKESGERVTLSCTNNNPPTLASEIRWVQNEAVLETISLAEDSGVNVVMYSTDDVGTYQCQVLSARANTTLLVVNVTVTENGGIVWLV